MQSRLLRFSILVGLTLCVFFITWEVVQSAYIPAAAQAAAEKGARLPEYQIWGVDFASYRAVWLVWGAAAIGTFWQLKKKERKQPVAFLVYCGFAAPLIATSALLIAPLAL